MATFAVVWSAPVHAAERGFSPRYDELKAQARVSRTDDAAALPPEAPAGIVVAPGVRFRAEGFVGAGYDSNIDHLTVADGGAYGLGELAAAIIAGPRTAETTAVVRGSFGYHDIDVRPERWDVATLIDHHRVIDQSITLNIGGFYVFDRIDTDPNQRASGYMEWAYKSEALDAYSRSRVMRTDYYAPLRDSLAATRLFSRDRTFDHYMLEQSYGLLVMKDRFLSPFAQIGAGLYDYYNQADTTVFDRDARELWAIAGVRVNLSKSLRVDVGARFNQRWLSDPNIDSHSATYFDGKLVWTPREGTYVEINAERFFNEPVSDRALFTESTVYSGSVVQYFDQLTRVKGEIGHITEEQIGSPETFRHLYGSVELSHRLDPHTEVYGSVLGYHTVEEASDQKADRFNFLIGARFSN